MSRRSWKRWFVLQPGCGKPPLNRRPVSRVLALETLAERITPAVNAIFSSGVLTVFGDNLNNTIDVSRDAAGRLLVNGGAVPIRGAAATAANTRLIQVFGQGGNDAITLREVSGILPRANLHGGAGNDMLSGGS